LIDYFRLIISNYMHKLDNAGAGVGEPENLKSSKITNSMMRGRRTLTTQHLDRYIFCLNCVMGKNFIPIIELIKEIRDNLEYNRSYRIDKKTVRRIVTILQSEGLVQIKEVEIIIQYEFGLPNGYTGLEHPNQIMKKEMGGSSLNKSESGSEYNGSPTKVRLRNEKADGLNRELLDEDEVTVGSKRQRCRVVPIVIKPSHEPSNEELRKYSSLMNPFRFKDNPGELPESDQQAKDERAGDKRTNDQRAIKNE